MLRGYKRCWEFKEIFYGAKNLSTKKNINFPRSKNLSIKKISDQL